MDFTIEPADMRYASGSAGANLGSIHAFPEQKVLYRRDTKAPLSVVSSRHKVVQPIALIEFYRDPATSGWTASRSRSHFNDVRRDHP